MRTTVSLPPDLQAEVERLRREEGLGVSEAVVALARRGLGRAPADRPAFRQATATLRARIDVTNVAEVLDLLDEER